MGERRGEARQENGRRGESVARARGGNADVNDCRSNIFNASECTCNFWLQKNSLPGMFKWNRQRREASLQMQEIY